MPLLPFKTRVRQEALARLGTIKAGVDYWLTPSMVTDSMLAPDQYEPKLSVGPVVGVMRAPGSAMLPATMTTEDGPGENDGIPPGFSAEIRFATWAYVRGALVVEVGPFGDEAYQHYPDNASELLDRVQQDIETCLRMDPTLGGLVSDLTPEGEDWNDGGETEPYGTYMQIWLARKFPTA